MAPESESTVRARSLQRGAVLTLWASVIIITSARNQWAMIAACMSSGIVVMGWDLIAYRVEQRVRRAGREGFVRASALRWFVTLFAIGFFIDPPPQRAQLTDHGCTREQAAFRFPRAASAIGEMT